MISIFDENAERKPIMIQLEREKEFFRLTVSEAIRAQEILLDKMSKVTITSKLIFLCDVWLALEGALRYTPANTAERLRREIER